MPFVIHLKDGAKVKNKKVFHWCTCVPCMLSSSTYCPCYVSCLTSQRWSQILYMYYFLQFRFPEGNNNHQKKASVTGCRPRLQTERLHSGHGC